MVNSLSVYSANDNRACLFLKRIVLPVYLKQNLNKQN